MADEENPVTSTITVNGNQNDDASVKLWKKVVWYCVVSVVVILECILLYCLYTLATIVVLSISLLVNTVLYLFNSARGKTTAYRIAVSPISAVAATVILLLTIILLSVWLGIVRGVDRWEHRVLAGLDVAQWLLIFIIVLGYYAIRSATHIPVFKWGFPQGLVGAVHLLLMYPTVLLIMKVNPSWKHRKILGLLVWKWIRSLVFIGFAQSLTPIPNYIVEFISKKVCCTSSEKCKGPKCPYYYTVGLRSCIAFIVVALMHFLCWRFYFCPRFIDNSAARRISDFGTWSIVCELICGFLWLIKNFILLSWKAHTVHGRPNRDIMYERSDDEILVRKLTYWFCLYSLDLVRLNGRPLKPNTDQSSTDAANRHKGWASFKDFTVMKYVFEFFAANVLVNTLEKNYEADWERKEGKWNKSIEALSELVTQEQEQGAEDKFLISIHDKPRVARAFLLDDKSLPENQDISSFCKKLYSLQDTSNQSATSSEHTTDSVEHNVAQKLFKDCQAIINKQVEQNGEYNIVDVLCECLGGGSGKILQKQLKEMNQNSEEPIGAEDFQAWMEKALQNCMQLQQHLGGARDVVKFLNRLMIGFVIALVIIIWLLLTEILPTKVIAVVTSPVLAATFIFGDTIKTMFQGIFFAYFMHPYTIGDLCVIDNIQMEVKQIGIWRTTFIKLGTEEEMLYPNTVLASQAITNNEDRGFHRHDSIFLTLDYKSDKDRVNHLGSYISYLLRPNKSGNNAPTSNSPSEIEEMVDNEDTNYVLEHTETNIKMTIHFEHNKSITDMTNTQAFNEKLKRKSEILERIACKLAENKSCTASTPKLEEEHPMISLNPNQTAPICGDIEEMS